MPEIIQQLKQFIYSPNNLDDENVVLFVKLLQSVLSNGLGRVTIAVEVDSIETIKQEVLNSLKPGDVVIKKTGTECISYIVSYKDKLNGGGEGEMRLTDSNSSSISTVFYDLMEGVWTYNKTISKKI